MTCLDQSLRTALRHPFHGLAVFHVRIHARGRIQEPCPQKPRRMRRISVPPGVMPGQRKPIDIFTHLRHLLLVGIVLHLRIYDPVLPNVWQTVRLRRIRPPIWRQAHEIMLITTRRHILFVHHTHRLESQHHIRPLHQLRQGGLLDRIPLCQRYLRGSHHTGINRHRFR